MKKIEDGIDRVTDLLLTNHSDEFAYGGVLNTAL